MKIAEAFVEVRVDNAKGRAEAKQAANDIAGELTKQFAQVFSAAVVVREFSKMIGSASRLEQAIGGTETMFGKAAAQIDRFAERSAESLGISEAAFRELTNQIGGLLQGLGFTEDAAADTSIQLTQLGADLAAAFGGRPEEAVQALGAALRGEFNPLERFGVSLRAATIATKAVEMGLAESTAEVDDNARAQAALALITEQTAKVQGQFGREAETVAGQQARLQARVEDLRAEIGTQLLPVVAAIIEQVAGVIDVFSSLPAPVQTAIVALLGIATVAGPISNTVKALGGLSGIIGKIPPQFAAVAAAAGAAFIAYDVLTSKSREAEARTREVSDALLSAVPQFDAAAEAASRTESAVDDLAVAMSVLSNALLTGDDGDKITQALGTIGAQADDLTEILIDLGDKGGASVDRLQAFLVQAGLTDEAARRFANTIDSVDGGGFGAFTQFTPEARAVAEALEELQDQAEKVDLNRIASEFLNAEVASNKVKAGLVEQAEATTGLSRSGEGAIAVFREYGRIVATIDGETRAAAAGQEDLGGSAGDAAGGIDDLADAINGATGAASDNARTTADVRSEFEELDLAAQRLADAIDRVFGANLSLDESHDRLLDGFDDVASSVEENGATLDRYTEQGRENRAAVRDQVGAIFDYANAMVESGSSATEAAGAIEFLRDGLINQLEASGLARDAAEEYVDQLGLTPSNIDTTITLSNKSAAEQAAADVQAAMEGVGETSQAALDSVSRNLDKEFSDAIAAAGAAGATGGAQAGVDTVVALTGALGAELAGLGASTGTLLSSQLNTASITARDEAVDIGRNIGAGVKSGIDSSLAGVAASGSRMVRAALGGAKASAKIESPSKLFRDEIGIPIVQGVEEGIRDEARSLASAMESAIDQALDAAIAQIDASVDAVSDRLGAIWDGIDARFDIEGLNDGVAEAEQRLAEARRDLAALPAALAAARSAVQGDLAEQQASIAADLADELAKLDRGAARDRGRAGSAGELAAIDSRLAADTAAAQRKATEERVAAERDAADELAEIAAKYSDDETSAREAISDATERLEDANRRLLRSSTELLDQGPAAVARFAELAAAAGLERGEIDALIASHNELANVRRQAEIQRVQVNAEAAQSNEIRTEFGRLASEGWFNEDQLHHLSVYGRDNPALGLQIMRDMINGVHVFVGGLPKFHNGGTVPGMPGTEVPIMAMAGEHVTPADGGGGPAEIWLVIEGEPFRAMLADHDAQTVSALRAGRRG